MKEIKLKILCNQCNVELPHQVYQWDGCNNPGETVEIRLELFSHKCKNKDDLREQKPKKKSRTHWKREAKWLQDKLNAIWHTYNSWRLGTYALCRPHDAMINIGNIFGDWEPEEAK